eukprot:SAG22_NODE_52_length_24288_cov_15.594568_5_plen_227_part_00
MRLHAQACLAVHPPASQTAAAAAAAATFAWANLSVRTLNRSAAAAAAAAAATLSLTMHEQFITFKLKRISGKTLRAMLGHTWVDVAQLDNQWAHEVGTPRQSLVDFAAAGMAQMTSSLGSAEAAAAEEEEEAAESEMPMPSPSPRRSAGEPQDSRPLMPASWTANSRGSPGATSDRGLNAPLLQSQGSGDDGGGGGGGGGDSVGALTQRTGTHVASLAPAGSVKLQ